MVDTYRITLQGPEFMVSQNAGVTVGVYSTQQEALCEIEACERDDFMLQTARSLVKELPMHTCECIILTTKRRTIGLEKRRTSM